MKNRKSIALLAALILVTLVVYFNRDRIHFDWAVFWQQVRHVSWIHIAAGIALIYSTYWLRSLRWSVFISASRRVSAFSLIGPQFIGFTGVALFGRLADLIRPALIAKRVDLPISSQLAVYTIERMFDLGAAAIIFSGALLFVPHDLPHREIFIQSGEVSLALTAIIAIFAVIIRVAGGAVANSVRAVLRRISGPIAESVATKIHGFRDGLNAISSAQDFVVTALISLAMWGLIGSAYVETLHAFTDTPELATLPFSRTMLLMGASIGGSAFQLPII
jgi:glycosyltransferase 2 family protein